MYCLFSLVFSATLQAQASKELNDQFLKILESFPSGFETLKNGVPKYDIKNNSFYSKVNISGTKYCFLEKDYRSGKLELLANIESDEELPMSVLINYIRNGKPKLQRWILMVYHWCLIQILNTKTVVNMKCM
ncbi:MAG: hypothetical protein IPK57_16730 [Chitinophagaceae bacterium]|nr:hypothetical protein [Chitinophagaceae bacterium]